MQRDLHRARGGARAAERRGVREVARLLEPLQQRHEHSAHRARVDGAVRGAAGLPVDRTDVEARAAANAREHLAVAAAGELRPAVVEDHDVKLVRPVLLARAPRAGDQRRVRRQALARAAPREQAQHHRQIGERRDEPLHADEHDVNARQARHEPSVPLVRDEHDRPGVADPEVRAGDADIGRMKRLPQLPPRGAGQLLELGRDGRAVHAGQELGHVLLRLLDGRREDVDGMLAGELEDVLAEIGLHRSDSRGLERLVEADLLRRHRLRLRGERRARVAADLDDAAVRVGGRVREERRASTRLDRVAEASHVPVEIVDHAEPRLVPARAEPLDVVERLPRAQPAAHEPLGGAVQGAADPRVRELQPRDLAKAAGRRRQRGHASTAARECRGEVDDRDVARFVLGAAAEVHEAARVGRDERVCRRRSGQLVVGHRQRDLGLPHRERATEPAAQVRPWQRHERSAGALEQPARRVGDRAAREACDTSRGTRPAYPRSSGRRIHRGRRGTRRAPRPRTAPRRAAPGGSARPSSRTSRRGRRPARSVRTP